MTNEHFSHLRSTLRAESGVALASRGGRSRWKIENERSIIQKNGGFDLEHADRARPGPIKNWHLLSQIAHLILQLLERGNLLGQDAQRLFGCFRNLAQRLAGSLRNRRIPRNALAPHACRVTQIPRKSS